MIDYYSRPAPSRVTPWIGNITDLEVMFRDDLDDGYDTEKEGLVLHYKDKNVYCKNVSVAARELGYSVSFMHKCINEGAIPNVDNLNSISSGYSIYTTKAVKTTTKVHIVMNGDDIYFESVVDAARYFGIDQGNIHRWERRGSCMSRGITSVEMIR